MNRDKLIELIEAELVKAEAADNDATFDKHIYAIHTLTSLYTESDSSEQTRATKLSRSSATPPIQTTSTSSSTTSHSVSAEEIRMMGGKVKHSPSKAPTTSDQRMVTDDAIGNGESIFDF